MCSVGHCQLYQLLGVLVIYVIIYADYIVLRARSANLLHIINGDNTNCGCRQTGVWNYTHARFIL